MKKLAWLPIWVALIIGAAAVWDCAHAQTTYSKFAPANGILKGSTTTYVTTPAVNTDVVSLFSGSCSASTYLSGSGVCSTPAGTGGGTVNSVGLTLPSLFTITGVNPITNTGTFAVTFATGQTANEFLATPNGTTGAASLRTIVAADLPAISLTGGVSGILPVPNGGIGVGTLTGIAKGNGTSVFTAAASADVIGLWSGTCTSSNFLRGDGACAVPSASGTVTSVGLSWTGSGLTIGGTPITTSGTLAISGALAAGSGGTGEAGTITGVLKGNGTGAHTAAVAADVYGLWSGTCSASTFLRGDGSCQAPAGATGANPTATVGPTATNGTATTFLRSDGAPGLCLTCSYTLTGTSPQITHSTAISTNNYEEWTNGSEIMFVGISSGNVPVIDVTSVDPLEIFTNGTQRLVVGAAGNFSFNAPTSGNTETITTLQNASPIEFVGPNTGNGYNVSFFDSTNSAFRGFIGIGASTVASAAVTDFAISPGASGSVVVGTANGSAIGTRFGPAGNVTINAPSSGPLLSLPNASSQIAWQTTNTQFGTGIAFSGGQAELASTGTTPLGVGASGAAALNLYTNSVDRIAISSSGNVVVNVPASGGAFTANGVAGTGLSSYVGTFIGSGTSGQSNGVLIESGFATGDNALAITNHAISATLFEVNGDGSVQVGSPTGGAKGAGSLNAQSLFVNNSAVCLASGANCPGSAAFKYAAGVVTISGASCTLNSSQGNTASCGGLSTGNVNINFSPAFSAATCVAGPVDSSPVLIATNPGTSIASTAQFILRNTSSSPTNGILSFICFGT